MDESLPLRRSTRNSVVLKNEEKESVTLTPRKKKVSTPVKVEPSTPSRRTRASSATPKKNLIESMSTPKKTLPVLNEEENVGTVPGTPSRKTKEISPKTPSRRRVVRESISTPTTKASTVDKTTKKPVETAEDTTVVATRPLTRAKRKTMGADILVPDTTKTSEPEKGVQNKKEKPEPEKKVQNKKDKTTSPRIDDKINTSPDNKSKGKQDKSCSALVPKIVLTDVKKQQAKEAKIPENVVDGDQCRVFTTKSPVRAEDVAINSPRKVPENCKSNSEVSLKSDADYISTRSREIKADSVNSISPVESTDLNSVEQGNHDSSINTKLDSDIVAKSPQIVTVSKDEDIPNIVITSPSPRKFTDSKDNNVPNIVIKCPSPQKATDSNGKNIPNIVIKCPSPQKDTDLNDKNIPNIVVTFPSPQKFSDSKENIKNDADSSSTSEQRNASPSKNETDSSDVKEKDMTPETSKSVNVDPEVSNTTEEKNLSSVEKEAEIRTTSSPEKINENIIKSSIKQKNDCVENDLVQTVMQVSTVETPLKIKENVPVVETAQIENKDSEELNKTFDKDNSNEHVAKDVSANKSDSKDLTDEDSFNLKSSNLDTSFLNKNSGESSPVDDSTIASNIPVAKEATMEAETTEKDSESTDEATSPCSPKIYMPSTSKVGSTEVMSSQTPSPNKAMPSTSKVGSTEATSSSSSNNMAPSTSKDENVNKTSMEANTAKNNGEEVGESSKEANNGSGINNATTSKEGDKPEAKSNSPSPEFPIQICNHRAPCDCYVSDDSMDSGIQNDDYDILLRFRNFSRFQNAYRQRLNSRRNVAPNEPEVEVPDIENLSEGTLDGSENKSTEGEVSEVKVSPEKSDDLKDDTLLVWKGDDLPKIAEPAEDGTDKNTGLDEILMSPKDFLKSDDESNVDCEKVDSRSEGVKEISNENKPLEEVANARVDPQSASGAHDDISSDVTYSAEDSSTKVDEKESDSGADHCKPSISETQDSMCTDVTHSNDAVQSSEDGTSKVVEEPGDSIIDRCKPSAPETQDNISSVLTQSNATITKDNAIKVDKEESEDVNNKQSISEVKENTSSDASHGNEADLTCGGTSIKVSEKEDDVGVDHPKSSEPGNISLYLTISSEAVQSSEDTSTKVDEKEDCDSHKSSKTKGQEMISSGLTPSTEGSSTKVEEVQNDGDADDSKQLTSGTEDNINLDVTKSIDVQSSEGLNKPKVNVEQDRADVNNLESSESDMQENINMDVTLSNEPSTEDSSNKVDEKEVDRHKMSSTETQESISSKFTESNDVQSSEDSSNIDEKQADSDVPAKSTFEVEINTSTNIPSDSKSETVPNDSEVSDKLKEICVDQEKEGSKDKSESVSVNDITEPVSVNDITEPVSVNDITEPVSVKDITEKAKADDSNQIIKSEINVQEESLDNSQSVCSHKEEEEEIKNGKSIETDLKIKDSEDKKENFVSPIKNKKSVENKSKKVSKKLDSETEDSELESEADSEYSNDPPSNAATEGSDRPMSGKDFIDFEAEEGEETSEDESFIAPSESESSSSDAELIQSFKMKLRKRKRNLEAASPKSDNYLDSVQRLFDSSENFLKDDDSHEEEEESVKVKKMKLEKEEAASNLNKKKRKPKSILKTQCTIVDSTESRSKNKVIREPSKTGVFIVSSISQDSEGPRVSRNISKGSKLRTGSKKSKFSDYESVAKGFNDSVAEDAALRGFVVTYDDSHLVAKKPRKAAAGWSESVIVKNKMKEGKNLKKNVKKSLRRDDIDETDAPNIVTLIMPYKMSIKSVSSVLTDLGISDISSVDIPKPKVAVVEFSSRESFKKILKLYGELKINDKPIYILEGCSLV